MNDARAHPLATRATGAASGSERERVALLGTLVALLALSTATFQFLLRAADDNRLVSWRWVFAPSDLPWLLALVALGVLGAFCVSRSAWIARRAAPALAASAFLATVPFWSSPEVIPDAARYFTQAKYVAAYGLGPSYAAWGREIPAWTDLPLVPLLYGALFGVAGEARIATQVFNSLLFAASALLAYRIGERLWDRSTGVHAALLLLGMPYLLTQVPLMLVDVAAMFLVTLAAFAAVAALERGGGPRIAVAAAALACALLAKYSAWIALVIPPLLAVSQPDARARALVRAGKIVLGALSLAGVLLLGKLDVVTDQLALLWSYQVPALARWQESAASTFLFQIHPFVTLAAACSVALAFARRDSRLAALGAIVLLAVLLGGRRIRYLVIVMPLFALVAACGLRAIRDLPTRRFAAACAAASSLVVAFSAYLPFLRNTSAANLMHAGELLDGLSGDAVEVIVLPAVSSGVNPAIAVPLLDLHTRKRVVYRRDLSPLQPPPAELRATSPVRFTWALPDAAFHLAPPEERAPVVLVMSAASQTLPRAVAERLSGYSAARDLAVSDRIFRYQTLVRIYRPA